MLIAVNEKALVKTTKELEEFRLREEDGFIRPSLPDFARLVVDSVASAEMKLMKTKWVVTERKHLFGMLTIGVYGTEIEVDDSVLTVFCRFSNDEKYAPRFVSAMRTDIVDRPYLVSLGSVGYRKKVTESAFLSDAVEEGILASYSKGELFPRIIHQCETTRVKKHVAFGMISQVFFDNNFPVTKSKSLFEFLERTLSSQELQTLAISDVLRAIDSCFKTLNIPDQYLMVAYGIPQIITMAGISLQP